jgi:hypothetical protein
MYLFTSIISFYRKETVMKFLFSKNLKIAVISFLGVVLTSVFLFSYPSGMTGRTLKTTTQGCGSCHTYSTNVTGSIGGPDTVIAGQTVQFTITVTDPNRSKAGVDIAVKLGTLDPSPSSADLKLQSGEITHLHAINMTNHTVTKTFNYIAPSTPGIDTIFATVSSGTPAWNWAPSKRVVVVNLAGTQNNQTAREYCLDQNYPNPFNPTTNISFELPKAAHVTVKVFDISGREILTLLDSYLESGSHEISWNAVNFSSGIYFYKLETSEFTSTRKMMLVK